MFDLGVCIHFVLDDLMQELEVGKISRGTDDRRVVDLEYARHVPHHRH